MGLDMYLTKKIYVGADYEFNKVTGTINIKRNGKPVFIDFKKVTYIEEKVAYWRKANQIHKWFVEHIQDGVDNCGTYRVSVEQLRKLLDLCKKVKASSPLVDGMVQNGWRYENGVKVPIMEKGKTVAVSEEAANLLPTEGGFFFGCTDYDQYYMDDIDSTIEMLEPALKFNVADDDFFSQPEFYYHASW